jgi:hypothetical protein
MKNTVNIRGWEYKISLGPEINGKQYVFASPKSGASKGKRFDIGYLLGGIDNFFPTNDMHGATATEIFSAAME